MYLASGGHSLARGPGRSLPAAAHPWASCPPRRKQTSSAQKPQGAIPIMCGPRLPSVLSAQCTQPRLPRGLGLHAIKEPPGARAPHRWEHSTCRLSVPWADPRHPEASSKLARGWDNGILLPQLSLIAPGQGHALQTQCPLTGAQATQAKPRAPPH